MRNFAIDTLHLITEQATHPNIILQTPITGFDSPEYRVNIYEKAGQDGSTASSMLYGSRTVTLTGIVKGPSPADHEAARIALIQASAISRDERGYPAPKRISFTSLSGQDYFCDAYFDRPILDIETPSYSRFMLTATVTDPFIFKDEETATAPITVATGGGFILPVILPITSTAASGGSVTVVNSGNVPAQPIITLVGPLANPYIYNETTDEFMLLKYTLAAGDTITIDMKEHLILLNKTSSLLGTKTIDSSWFTLAVGMNDIAFSTTNSADTGTMKLKFHPPTLGI